MRRGARPRIARRSSSGVPAATTSPPRDARLGAQVDDPVGRLDHVEVVLDDDDRVAEIDQPVQHVEQLADVVEVQAGRRLVEEVERLAGVGPGQLGGQLDALGLAAGERRRGLAERQVVEADVVQRLQDVANLGDVAEQLQRLARRACSARRRWTCPCT